MAHERWTVQRVIRWTTEHFQKKGLDNPRLEAEVLLAYLLEMDRMGLYLNYDRPLKEEERTAYREMIQRRLAKEPLAYIVGSKEFWSLRFAVNPECLIPRPETEHLVEEAIRIGKGLKPPLRILEIGQGCGAVAIALATELGEAEIVATDISPEACSLAQENAERHGVEGRIRFVRGDLFPPGEEPFGLICSNPPYIPTAEVL
jgi:release factor glutamine methyltransferase